MKKKRQGKEKWREKRKFQKQIMKAVDDRWDFEVLIEMEWVGDYKYHWSPPSTTLRA